MNYLLTNKEFFLENVMEIILSFYEIIIVICLITMNYTFLKSIKEYEFIKDYELNDDDEKYFKLEEIEVFQINKKL